MNRVEIAAFVLCYLDSSDRPGLAGALDHVDLSVMRSARPSTAKRWADHWRAGGAVKTLRRTRVQHAAWRKEAAARTAAWNARCNS